MNYMPAGTEFPSGSEFVVEDPKAQTFFVNREVFVSNEVFEREKRASLQDEVREGSARTSSSSSMITRHRMPMARPGSNCID